jgi:hypothetical protein
MIFVDEHALVLDGALLDAVESGGVVLEVYKKFIRVIGSVYRKSTASRPDPFP